MFEPIHGSAPKYTGKGIVNPVASIEAMRMLLEHIGLEDATKRIQNAVSIVLKSGKIKTFDMGGSATTSQMGDAIASFI